MILSVKKYIECKKCKNEQILNAKKKRNKKKENIRNNNKFWILNDKTTRLGNGIGNMATARDRSRHFRRILNIQKLLESSIASCICLKISSLIALDRDGSPFSKRFSVGAW